jgi:isoquinoline 1-oxidoreductase subunit beta
LSEEQRRDRAVLELPAEKSGWSQPLPAGRARGLAIHDSFGSVVGEVAEASMENRPPRLHRVVAEANFDTYQALYIDEAGTAAADGAQR